MGHGGELLRIEQLAVSNPERVFVRFRAGRPVSDDDYFFGHCVDDSSTRPKKATRRHPIWMAARSSPISLNRVSVCKLHIEEDRVLIARDEERNLPVERCR